MQQMSNIQVRIDAKLKKQADKILENMGMDLPTLIRMTLKRMVIMKNMPFAMGHSEEIDENGFTKKQRKELNAAIKEMNDPKAKRHVFDNAEDFIKDLNS